MRDSQVILTPAGPQAADFQSLNAVAPRLALAFGSIALLRQHAAALRQGLPQVQLCGCSTASEISYAGGGDNSLVLTTLRFEATRFSLVSTEFHGMEDSCAAGQRLARNANPSAGDTLALLVSRVGRSWPWVAGRTRKWKPWPACSARMWRLRAFIPMASCVPVVSHPSASCTTRP